MSEGYVPISGLKKTKKGIIVPEEMVEGILSTYHEMERYLTTLEILADEDALASVVKSRKEINNGDYVDASAQEIDNILK